MAQAQLVKFYEYDYNKPELSDDTLIHFGVKGMKWGVRKDGKPQGYQGGNGRITKKSKPSEKKVSRRQQRKAAKQVRKKYNTQLKRDLDRMYNDPESFSNKQKNDIMNDINTQERLEKMYKDHTSIGKAKQILRSPEFKKIAAITVVTLPVLVYTAKKVSYDKNLIEGPNFTMSDVAKPKPPYDSYKDYTGTMLNLLLGVKKPK